MDQRTAENKLIRKPGRNKDERMRLHDAGVPLLTFPLLDACKGITHGFTTRDGGVSDGVFSTLNLSFTRGDEETHVRENFRRVADALGVEEDRFVFTDQTHTTNVRVVTEGDAGKGLTRPRDYTDVDGLVTNVPGLVLSVFTADCVPLYFYDPVHRAIGLSHSGWKGTAGRIGRVTLETMRETYGTDPADVLCAIAPSICQECYEISRDVAEVFAAEFAGHEAEVLTLPPAASETEKRTADALLQKLSGGAPEDKFHLDLWAANRIVLEEAGVQPEHIAVTDICTCCNPERLFSHRASCGKRGNLGAFLYLQ